jgi:hypothetical protein
MLSAVINNNNLINILTYMVLVIRLYLELSLALLIKGIIKSIMINILVLFKILCLFSIYPLLHTHFKFWRGRRGRDRMIVGLTIIYAISAYHH